MSSAGINSSYKSQLLFNFNLFISAVLLGNPAL
jgi:hypothetical protein